MLNVNEHEYKYSFVNIINCAYMDQERDILVIFSYSLPDCESMLGCELDLDATFSEVCLC